MRMRMARPLGLTCLESTPQFLHPGKVTGSTVHMPKVRFKEAGCLSKLTEAGFKAGVLPSSLPFPLPPVEWKGAILSQ